MANAGQYRLCWRCERLLQDLSVESYGHMPVEYLHPPPALLTERPTYDQRNKQRSLLPLHTCLQSVWESQQPGCALCLEIPTEGLPDHTVVISSFTPQFRAVDPTPSSRWECLEEFDLHIKLYPPNPERPRKFDTPSFWHRMNLVRVDESQDLRQMAERARAEGSTGHANVSRLAHGWLQVCLRQHSRCAPNTQPLWTPARLLRVDQGSVRLVETSLDKPREQQAYATLSHCWGGASFLVLDDDTDEGLRSGVGLSQLPRNLTDPAVITRHLGVAWLWIHSLCIMQAGEGSVEDKKREIASMADIYENAIFSISATATHCPPDGLFREGGSSNLQPKSTHQPKYHLTRACSKEAAVRFDDLGEDRRCIALLLIQIDFDPEDVDWEEPRYVLGLALRMVDDRTYLRLGNITQRLDKELGLYHDFMRQPLQSMTSI
ncbi:hypothetical protein LTR09_006443 [Extremus antarcticus]|uniref:Heterokaryon incompatibility domain-containing protein n=1 Tax=Extremus antarcticus TaxID=702011 RepID=A0AAJ0G7X2_9PEZI|nr:hypothetical protein LTR09_006443 [Extremus antarcticus]